MFISLLAVILLFVVHLSLLMDLLILMLALILSVTHIFNWLKWLGLLLSKFSNVWRLMVVALALSRWGLGLGLLAARVAGVRALSGLDVLLSVDDGH